MEVCLLMTSLQVCGFEARGGCKEWNVIWVRKGFEE